MTRALRAAPERDFTVHHRFKKRSPDIMYTIAIVLLILWLLGFLTLPAVGGLIHILLVIAVIVLLVRIISGRRAI